MYYLFILLVGAERLVELAVSRRNAAWSFAHGGREFGAGHYPVMVSMHALLLVSCVVEVATAHRPFIAWLGWPMVAVVVASTGIRWWCVAALGKHRNPRLIVIPGVRWSGAARTGGCITRTTPQSPWRWRRCRWCIPRGDGAGVQPRQRLVLHVRIQVENGALGYA